MTQQEIADAWFEESGQRVTRNAISLAMRRYGLQPTYATRRHVELLPWRVRGEHRYHYDARMLRMEARRRAGLPLDSRDELRLDAWLRRLRQVGAVVYYDPETAPGFWWVHRDPTDADIIRRPRAQDSGNRR